MEMELLKAEKYTKLNMRNLDILIKVRTINNFSCRMRKRKKELRRDIMNKMLKMKEKSNCQRRKRHRKRNLRNENKQIMNDTIKSDYL